MTSASPRRRFVRPSAAAVALLTAALVSGCSDNGDTSDSEGMSEPPSASPSDEETTAAPVDPDEGAVLTAYQGYWDEYVNAVSEDALPDYVQAINDDAIGETPLADYTALTAQQQVLQHVLTLDEAGQYMSGAPERLDPVVAETDLEADIPTATVTDCLNVEPWLGWGRETGEQLTYPEERQVQYSLTAELEQWEGTWRVTSAAPDEESTC